MTTCTGLSTERGSGCREVCVPKAFYSRSIQEGRRNAERPDPVKTNLPFKIHYDRTVENVIASVISAGTVVIVGTALGVVLRRLKRG